MGIKTLDRELISHATAINNTLRQISGAIGSAILITIMTSATKKAHMSSNMLSNIHGIDVAFSIAATLAFTGLIVSICFIKDIKLLEVNTKELSYEQFKFAL